LPLDAIAANAKVFVVASQIGGMSSGSAGSAPSADLLGVVAATALFVVVSLVDPLRAGPYAWLVALPYVLFVPGYAVVAALYPDDETTLRPTDAVRGGASDPGLGTVGRLALGVGASVGAVAAVGITLDFTVWGFQRLPLVSGIAVFALAATGVAALRRRAAARPAGVGRAAVSLALGDALGRDALGRALTALAVLCVLGAAGAVVATNADHADARAASFVTDGSANAADYPRNLTVGERTNYTLLVENGANAPANATVVTQLQTVETDGDVAVRERREVARTTVAVPADGSATATIPVTPATTGERRLACLVYFGGAPANATAASADREVHLWVTVRDAGGAGA